MTENTKLLDSAALHAMLRGGWLCLCADSDEIDALNVFPVPDGDTGKNMSKTMENAVRTARDFAGESRICDYLGAFSRGALLGARGNSGVILSQFIRGIAVGLQSCEQMSPSDFVRAFSLGKKYSYEAVFRPAEGTMLTLMRQAEEMLFAGDFSDFEELFDALLPCLRQSLARTPELLAVLRQAGVVDSGGAGLLRIFEGMGAVLRGVEPQNVESMQAQPQYVQRSILPDANDQLGYCTEFILQLLPHSVAKKPFSLEEVNAGLLGIGESLVSVQDGELWKVHLHTQAPEEALALAHPFGEFLSVKIENMTVQHEEQKLRTPARPRQRYGIVAAVQGDGLAKLFTEMGADLILPEKSPSTDEFLHAIADVRAEEVVVLPNDKDALLAAVQAVGLCQGNARVLPTTSAVQGFGALCVMNPSEADADRFYAEMEKGMNGVTTAAVALAAKDAVLDGVQIHAGDYMGLYEDRVYIAGKELYAVVQALFAALPQEAECDVVTVFSATEPTEEEQTALREAITTQFPQAECGFFRGGQPTWRYLFALE